MPRNKLTALLCLALMLLAFACTALADANTVTPVDADRIFYALPLGIKDDQYSVSTTPGNLNISINSKNLDWEKILLYGYDPDTGYVNTRFGFTKPSEDAVYVRTTGISYGEDTDDAFVMKILDELEVYDQMYETDEASNGHAIARYIAETELLQPQSVRDTAIITRWYDKDGNILCNELLVINIILSDTAPLYQSLAVVPADRVVAGALDNDNGTFLPRSITGQTTTIIDGLVRNEYADIPALEATISNDRTYYAVYAPEGADDEWTCKTAQQGSTPTDKHITLLKSGTKIGGVTLNRPAVILDTRHNFTDFASTETFVIEWINESSETAEVSQLSMQTVVGNPLPWPYYVPSWDPIDPERMTFLGSAATAYENGGKAVNGVNVEIKRDGWLHLSPSGATPDGSALEKMDFAPTVTAPTIEGVTVTHYSSNNCGANNIFGSARAERDQLVQEEITGNREEHLPVPEGGVVTLHNIAPVMRHDHENVTVYLPTGMNGAFSGGVQPLFWYDASGNVVKKEYLVNTQAADSFASVHVTPALPSGSTPEGRVEWPVIILHPSQGGQPYTLVIEMYPQVGENAVYYELYLTDEDDERVKLKGNSTLYLPYPEGYDTEDEFVFVIEHLNPVSFEKEETFTTTDGITLDKHGIWVTVNSLSPFILSWSDGENGGSGGEEIVIPDSVDESAPGCSKGDGNHKLIYEVHAIEDGPGHEILQRCANNCGHMAVFYFEMNNRFTVGEEVTFTLEPVIEGPLSEWLGRKPAPYFFDNASQKRLDQPPTEIGEYDLTISLINTSFWYGFIIEDENSGGGFGECDGSHPHLMQFIDGCFMVQICNACGSEVCVLEISMPEFIAQGANVGNELALTPRIGEWRGADNGGSDYVVVWRDANGRLLDQAPTAPGSYSVEVVLEYADEIAPGEFETHHYESERFFFTIVPAAVNLPQTGDSAPGMMLPAMALLLAACAMSLLFRRRAH